MVRRRANLASCAPPGFPPPVRLAAGGRRCRRPGRRYRRCRPRSGARRRRCPRPLRRRPGWLFCCSLPSPGSIPSGGRLRRPRRPRRVAGAWLPAGSPRGAGPGPGAPATKRRFRRGRGPVSARSLAASLGASVIPPVDDLPWGLSGYRLPPGGASCSCRQQRQPSPAGFRPGVAPRRASPPPPAGRSRSCGGRGGRRLTSVAPGRRHGHHGQLLPRFRRPVAGAIAPADLYVRTLGGACGPATLDVAEQTRIANLPGIAAVRFTRHDSLRLAGGRLRWPDRPPGGGRWA